MIKFTRKNKVSRAEKERLLYNNDFIQLLMEYYSNEDDEEDIGFIKAYNNPKWFYIYMEMFLDEIK